MNRFFMVSTPPVPSLYSRWIFEHGLHRLIFSVPYSRLVVLVVAQFSCAASSGLTLIFRIDYRVLSGKLLLVLLSQVSVSLVSFTNFRSMAYSSN